MASVFHDPNAVAQQRSADRPDVAADVRRGQRFFEGTLPAAWESTKALGRGAERLYQGASRPWAGAARVLPHLSRALGNRGVQKALLGTVAIAPVVGMALRDSTVMRTPSNLGGYGNNKGYPWSPDNALSLTRQGIEITASEEDKMDNVRLLKQAGLMDLFKGIGSGLTSTATGEGIGGRLMGNLFTGLAGLGVTGAVYGGGKLHEMLSVEPARKRLLEGIIKTDPVIVDAVRRDPKIVAMLEQTYQTMVRFAPSISMDPNAVSSFLREAVLSGGGVNYATIKMLAETEKEINYRHSGGKGK